jgi:D-lactate dehydrogenase
MDITVFSTKSYDEESLRAANVAHGHELTFLETRLDARTARLAEGASCVCAFVNDELDRGTLEALRASGTQRIALRCAGFNNVDLEAARELGFTIVRVPAYSPHAVAEHTVALALALNRRVPRAYSRVREGNFSLEGLMGFDLVDRTVGVVGTGKIGRVFARIMHGFGCRVLAYDPYPHADLDDIARYVPLEELLAESNIVSLHCPLTPDSHHLINETTLASMKRGVMLINTSRGALVDTRAVVAGLKSGHVGYLGLDVYEEEADLFFEDLSTHVLQDDVFARLITFPNVIITGHQAFFTREAMETIASVTLQNAADLERGAPCPNALDFDVLLGKH